MIRSYLLKYEGCSVKIDYETEIDEQIRTGTLYSVGQEVIIFWPFELESEVLIRFEDIKSIDLI
ncbi:hypothetical protein ES705_19841 [subsurface metagenome]